LTGDALVGDTEDFEKVDQERLVLAVFIAGIRPVTGKRGSAGFDFVPREWHGGLRLLFACHATQFHGAMPICVVRLCVGFSDRVVNNLLE
jgi:hypothetical protein